MRIEIHTRPLILAKLAGQTDCAQEVDVWLFTGDEYDCGSVILEAVVPSKAKANKMIDDLVVAFASAAVIVNDNQQS
jgi:hypothetical protein